MFKEFKEFAMRGNVVDMAVGIVIGVAFGAIVKSFVDDLLMPPIGLLLGGVDFTDLFINMGEGEYTSLAAAKEAGAPTLNYGLFINAVLNFIIIAFAIFMLIKGMNKLVEKKEAAPAGPSKSEQLLTEIRDLLKAQR